jgi:uncharacterized protein YdaT
MANNTITCPVCGSVMNSYQEVCPDCGYEIHLLPDDAPKAVVEYEARRAQKARNLKEEKFQLEHKLESKQSEIDRLSAQVAEVNEHAEKIKKDLEETIRQLQQEKSEAVQRAAEQASVKQPVAYLVVKDGETIVDMYGLEEGENTFGYARDGEKHHQVLYGYFCDQHFSISVAVSTNDHGRKNIAFTVTPLEGQVCMAPNGANLISGTTTIDVNTVVYVGDINFTLVLNKNYK